MVPEIAGCCSPTLASAAKHGKVVFAGAIKRLGKRARSVRMERFGRRATNATGRCSSSLRSSVTQPSQWIDRQASSHDRTRGFHVFANDHRCSDRGPCRLRRHEPGCRTGRQPAGYRRRRCRQSAHAGARQGALQCRHPHHLFGVRHVDPPRLPVGRRRRRLEARAVAGDELEAPRRPDAGSEAAPGREIPERRRLHG